MLAISMDVWLCARMVGLANGGQNSSTKLTSTYLRLAFSFFDSWPVFSNSSDIVPCSSLVNIPGLEDIQGTAHDAVCLEEGEFQALDIYKWKLVQRRKMNDFLSLRRGKVGSDVP